MTEDSICKYCKAYLETKEKEIKEQFISNIEDTKEVGYRDKDGYLVIPKEEEWDY